MIDHKLFARLLICEPNRFNSMCLPITTPETKSEWLVGKFGFDKFLNFPIMKISNYALKFKLNKELFANKSLKESVLL